MAKRNGKTLVIVESPAKAKTINKYLGDDFIVKAALGISDERAKRVIFNAITKSEIKKAFEKPHKIDIDRVNAQQARRILDRIVGYEISPLLWRKVAKGLSAGRVQSVAVRLIVDREREIEAFMPEEYWKITALLAPQGRLAI